MKEFLIVGLIFVININLIASKFVCRFIDKNRESIELSCDGRDKFHWADDNCTSIIFDQNSQDPDQMSVRSLKVGSCQREIQENDKKFVKHFKNIEKIDVSTANIRNGDISVFSYIWRFQHLKFINASHNELTEISFILADNVNEVDFSHNHISNSFWGISDASFITINLSHNRISNLPGDYFSHSKELQILDLSYNQISKISPFFFKNCPKLKILRLDHNQITTFGEKHWVCVFFIFSFIFELIDKFFSLFMISNH